MYEMLVDLLVATALVDRSVPPCWRTNELLGAIERLVAVARGQYAEFAKIASTALEKLGGQWYEPEVRALIKLAVLNGRRWCDTENPADIRRLFDEVGDDIRKLEEGPRKHRCLTFFQYQMTVFMGDKCGLYAEAAKSAEAEASLNTEPDKRAISKYIARMYAMYAAIVSDERQEIHEAFELLKHELRFLQQAVAGTALEVQWGWGNGPIDLLKAMILCDKQDVTLWDNNMTVVLSHKEELGEAFKPSINILLAERSRRNGDSLGAISDVHRNVIDRHGSSLADKAWGYLILARTQSMLDPEGAAKSYVSVPTVLSARVVGAVAVRELAQLQK